jgi:hypothetical protein
MGAVEHLKTLCCLGLPPESAMVAVVPVLHEIIPHGWSRLALLAPDAAITSTYLENPAMGPVFRKRLWQFMDDPSALVSLWIPSFRAVAIGWSLHKQGHGYLQSGYYREIEAPLDSCWILSAMIGDGGRSSSFVSLSRPRSARPFTVDDLQRLDRLRPWLAYAFRRRPTDNQILEDEAPISTAGPTLLNGQLLLTAEAELVYQSAGIDLLLGILGGEPGNYTLRAYPRQAAFTGSEASPADHRHHERNVKRAASRASLDALWRSHARSQMARAGWRTCGRCRQRSEILSYIGDDRTARAPHCPCRPDLAGKRRHARADESRHSPRLGQTETYHRGRTRRPNHFGRGSCQKALSDSRCTQFHRASHKNLAGPKASRGAPKLEACRIDRGLVRKWPMATSLFASGPLLRIS